MARKYLSAFFAVIVLLLSAAWAEQSSGAVEPSELMRLLSSLKQYPNVQEIVEDSETVRAALVALAMGEVVMQDGTMAVSFRGTSFVGYTGETGLVIAFPMEDGEYVIFLANAVSGSSEVAKGVAADVADLEQVLKENCDAIYAVAENDVRAVLEDLQSVSQTGE